MAIDPTPTTLLVPTLMAGVALAVRGGWRRRAGARPGLRVPLAAAFGFVLLVGLCWVGFDTAERRIPIIAGLAIGAVLGLMFEWLMPPDAMDPADLGPLGAGLAGLAALGLAVTPGVPFANASLGLLAGWSIPQIARVTAPKDPLAELPGAPGFALAVLGLVAGSAAWAARLSAQGSQAVGLLWPLALALGAIAALGLALAGLTGTRRAGPLGALVAALVFVLAGLALAGGPYGQPQALLLALGAGGFVGFLGGAFEPREGTAPPVSALLALSIAGGLLVLENRLLGILAIGLGGIGLAVGAGGERGPRPMVTLVVAIFAARVWLQLFLDRTNMTGYGVDMTHSYVFAALILGGLLPTAAIAIGRACRLAGSLTIGWALALAVLPAWLGYLLHVEALGGLLAGLLLAAFAIGARGREAGAPALDPALAVVPALLLQTIAVTLLAAPWLVEQLNAPRDVRVQGFLITVALLTLGLGRWWLAARRPVVA